MNETDIDPTLYVKKVEVHDDGRMEILGRCEAVPIIADALYDAFLKCGGVNYVEWHLVARAGNEPFVLTFQRKLGKSADQLRREAEAQVAVLQEALRWAIDELELAGPVADQERLREIKARALLERRVQ